MKLEEFLRHVVQALHRASLAYMLTGSVAGTLHGLMRSTRDVDIVVDPARDELVAFIRGFPVDEYYADEEQALQALAQRSLFNVIHSRSGWKADFIFCKPEEFSRAAFRRREQIAVGDLQVWTTTAEDLVISKLRWAKLGASQRQIEDAADLLRARNDLDRRYIEDWVQNFGLAEQWQAARAAAE